MNTNEVVSAICIDDTVKGVQVKRKESSNKRIDKILGKAIIIVAIISSTAVIITADTVKVGMLLVFAFFCMVFKMLREA